MPYRVEFSPTSDKELKSLRAFDQRQIVSQIRLQLTTEPNIATRNRKCLGYYLTADFEYIPPLWELRVGQFRVFYEVDEAEQLVYVHAVRRKGKGQTTTKVLNETNDD
jgi:mRNA-degrading endonuclease RelE of RelBE toxin-antitoxin system